MGKKQLDNLELDGHFTFRILDRITWYFTQAYLLYHLKPLERTLHGFRHHCALTLLLRFHLLEYSMLQSYAVNQQSIQLTHRLHLVSLATTTC